MCFSGCGFMARGLRPSINSVPQTQREEILAAMIAVEYWAERGPRTVEASAGSRRVMSFSAAKRIIDNDQTYGSGNRRHRVRQVCLILHSGNADGTPIAQPVTQASANTDAIAACGTSEDECVAGINSCNLKRAAENDPEADIRFTVDVPSLTLAQAAWVLDPQTWDQELKSNFGATFRTGSTCPDTSGGPPTSTLPDDDIAQNWEGSLYEHYKFDCTNQTSCTSFHTSLCIDAEYSTTEPQYRLAYELCDPDSYGENILNGGAPSLNALVADGGFCHANAGVSPTKVTCVKRIAYHDDVCSDGMCDDEEVKILHAGLRVLMGETAIALSRKAGLQEDEVCADSYCYPPEGDSTFLLPTYPGIDATPFQCGM